MYSQMATGLSADTVEFDLGTIRVVDGKNILVGGRSLSPDLLSESLSMLSRLPLPMRCASGGPESTGSTESFPRVFPLQRPEAVETLFYLFRKVPGPLHPSALRTPSQQPCSAPSRLFPAPGHSRATSAALTRPWPGVGRLVCSIFFQTGERKYRDQGWRIFLAFEQHCKASGGYSGLRDVRQANPVRAGIRYVVPRRSRRSPCVVNSTAAWSAAALTFGRLWSHARRCCNEAAFWQFSSCADEGWGAAELLPGRNSEIPVPPVLE